MAKMSRRLPKPIGPEQDEQDRKFYELLLQKIKEVKDTSDPIFNHVREIRLRNGCLCLVPPQLDDHILPLPNPYYGYDDSKEADNEDWLRRFWDMHPEKSLADALREYIGIRNPAIESTHLSLYTGHLDDGTPIKNDITKNPGYWSSFWRLRGHDHILETFELSIAKDASKFTKACATTIIKISNLDRQIDIESLEKIQTVMLNVLMKHKGEYKNEIRRRIDEAIHALEKSLGHIESMAAWIIASTQEEIKDKSDKKGILLAGQALRDEDTDDKRSSLIPLLNHWPVKSNDKHPYTLSDLLSAMWNVDKIITCMAIRGNCRRQDCWGDEVIEIETWKQFMGVALSLSIGWRNDHQAPEKELKKTIKELQRGLKSDYNDKMIKELARLAFEPNTTKDNEKQESPIITNQELDKRSTTLQKTPNTQDTTKDER